MGWDCPPARRLSPGGGKRAPMLPCRNSDASRQASPCPDPPQRLQPLSTDLLEVHCPLREPCCSDIRIAIAVLTTIDNPRLGCDHFIPWAPPSLGAAAAHGRGIRIARPGWAAPREGASKFCKCSITVSVESAGTVHADDQGAQHCRSQISVIRHPQSDIMRAFSRAYAERCVFSVTSSMRSVTIPLTDQVGEGSRPKARRPCESKDIR